jgi:hypothetical protein
MVCSGLLRLGSIVCWMSWYDNIDCNRMSITLEYNVLMMLTELSNRS